jgi:hypothetical protein
MATPTASAGGSQGGGQLPPLSVSGVRRVDLRNESGGLTSYTSIPSASKLQTYGGRRSSCSFTAVADGHTSDGQTVEKGQVVLSQHWIFREGLPASFGEPNLDDPAGAGPLSGAVRSFVVFCDVYDANHSVGFLQIPASDPMVDPHTQLTPLYNGLQLVRPVLYHDPVLDRWGGLVVRLPAWLAVQPAAWTSIQSNVAYYRGWTLYLLAQPAALEFLVDFTPNPDKPTPAFHGIVGCVGADQPIPDADGTAFPALPLLPEQTEPGVNGPCEWTPPGPGMVTIQARVGYHVTFWANGFTEAQPDYIWTSQPVTMTTGELTAVNLDPTT